MDGPECGSLCVWIPLVRFACVCQGCGCGCPLKGLTASDTCQLLQKVSHVSECSGMDVRGAEGEGCGQDMLLASN